ncbi:OST-HTH/LOTUS domain-containing protein [Cupriavidus sp. CP313]
MTSEPKPIGDEVLRRLGRNLLLFQQIEHLLKLLLSTHRNGGTVETYKENLRQQKNAISKKMLGQLVEKYGKEILRDAGEEVPEEERPEDWFFFTFRISGDTEFIESLRRDLKLMTDERNDPVHHFLPRWQPDSAERMEEALAYLDAQRNKVLHVHEHLKHTANSLQEAGRHVLEFVNSPEYAKQAELMWLQASPLVRLLCDVATQTHRKDGWTYLAQAGDLATKEMPEEIKALKERYGFRTLKKLLVGSELFDVFDEPLPNAAFRTLFRLRSQN